MVDWTGVKEAVTEHPANFIIPQFISQSAPQKILIMSNLRGFKSGGILEKQIKQPYRFNYATMQKLANSLNENQE